MSATIAIVRDEVAIGFQVVIQFARQLAPFETFRNSLVVLN